MTTRLFHTAATFAILGLAGHASAGYWQFEEGADGSGSTGTAPSTIGHVVDSHASSEDGTAKGGPVYITGPTGLAMQFSDNNSDYVEIPNSALVNQSENQDFTIELLARVDGASSDGSTANWILSKDFTNTSNNGWGVYWNDNNGTVTANFGGTSMTSSSTINDGEWHHLAITHAANSSTYKLYVDYTEETSMSHSAGAISSAPLWIGRGWSWQEARDFVGAVDEFRITKDVLTTEEFVVIPEPGSLGLCVAGGLVLLRRRRR